MISGATHMSSVREMCGYRDAGEMIVWIASSP
jgi:hypothetical protein